MALNGLIGTGVPQDWSTHLIGHELTAFHGIDHGRTLAVVFPGVMNLKRQNKKEKLIQYGERIWGITEGNDDKKIDAAIAKTVDFFESLNVPTKLPDYNVTKETVEKIAARFKASGDKLGEKADMDYLEIEQILESRF